MVWLPARLRLVTGRRRQMASHATQWPGWSYWHVTGVKSHILQNKTSTETFGFVASAHRTSCTWGRRLPLLGLITLKPPAVCSHRVQCDSLITFSVQRSLKESSLEPEQHNAAAHGDCLFSGRPRRQVCNHSLMELCGVWLTLNNSSLSLLRFHASVHLLQMKGTLLEPDLIISLRTERKTETRRP